MLRLILIETSNKDDVSIEVTKFREAGVAVLRIDNARIVLPDHIYLALGRLIHVPSTSIAGIGKQLGRGRTTAFAPFTFMVRLNRYRNGSVAILTIVSSKASPMRDRPKPAQEYYCCTLMQRITTLPKTVAMIARSLGCRNLQAAPIASSPCLGAGIVQMGAGCSTDTDSPNHISANFDGQPSAQNKDIAVDIAKGLKRGNLRDEIGQLTGGTSHTYRRIGFLSATIDRMWPGTIRTFHRTKNARSINHRHAHAIPIFLASFQCRLNRFIRHTKR